MEHQRYKVTLENNYTYIVLRGEITAQDVVEIVKYAVEITQHDKAIPSIWDVTAADLSNIDFNIVMETAEVIAQIKKDMPKIPVGLVSEKDINKGTMAFFKYVYEKDIVNVFESHEDAEKWIETQQKS